MLERLLSNGVRTIVVETANRFARDLIVQEVGYAMLKERGIKLIAADSPDAFLDDTPTAVMIRQILGAVSQFEKAMLVSKLRGARDRKNARPASRSRAASRTPRSAPKSWRWRSSCTRRRCRCARSRRNCSRTVTQQERQTIHAAIDRQHAGLNHNRLPCTSREAFRLGEEEASNPGKRRTEPGAGGSRLRSQNQSRDPGRKHPILRCRVLNGKPRKTPVYPAITSNVSDHGAT